MVKHIVALSAFVMCLMLVAPMMNVGASGIKLDESIIGQKQTVNGMTSKDFYLHVNRGDNISFESVKVSQGYGVGIRAGAGGNVFYLKSSNDSFINGWNIFNTQLIKFWFIPSTEDIIDFYIFTGYVAGCSVDFYINRTNVTSGDQRSNITALEKSMASLNSTMNNLSKSISSINVRINELSDTTNNSFLAVNIWISQLRNETNVLRSRLNNLTIPAEVNLTELYNQVNALSELVISLQENVSRLSIMNNVTIDKTLYINNTNNVTHYQNQTNYIYDNKTLDALKENITESIERIRELENTIIYTQNETGQVAGNVTNLQTKVNFINNTTVEKTEIRRFVTVAEARNYAIVGALIFVVVVFVIWNTVLMHEIKKIQLDKELEQEVLEREDKEEHHHHGR